MQASRELSGKSYFSLGHPERMAVDAAVGDNVRANYRSLTAEFLTSQEETTKNPTPKQLIGFPGTGPKNTP
jgi:hypothetical protein